MPSFMPIGPKLWALEGYIQTHTQTVLFLLYRLALRVTSCLFRLALRGYSVASLPRASRYALATYPMSLPGSQGVSMPSFMPKMQKKKFYPLDALRA